MPRTGEPLKPHLFPQATSHVVSYKGRGRGPAPHILSHDRHSHGQALQRDLDMIKLQLEATQELQQQAGMVSDFGITIEFESFPDFDLAFPSLSSLSNKIELLNTRLDESTRYATVFVPYGSLGYFEKRIHEYLDPKKDTTKKLPKNSLLVSTIKSIRAATLRALWTDPPGSFPSDPTLPFWWEIWLPVRNSRESILNTFKKYAHTQGLHQSTHAINFPERSVTLLKATREQMETSIMLLNCIAELRQAKDTADFFLELSPQEQASWKDDLLERTTFAASGTDVPHICIMDTGINRGHPLLSATLDSADMHAVSPDIGVDDKNGHGTGMAGLAAFGNLRDALQSKQKITISHRLESVKLLNQDGDNQGDRESHGYLTSEGVSRVTIRNPYRKRLFQLAISADEDNDKGRPSAWSAKIDSLCFNADSPKEYDSRLFVISAGNVRDPNAWCHYPDSNSETGCIDPAQAWNALTVGAHTELVYIDDTEASGLSPVAEEGGLSPFSTTSVSWDLNWPYKPDIVMEGGNVAKDRYGAVEPNSLSLLTTHKNPLDKLFASTNATSAASAQASHMAALIMAQYPLLRAETIRALIVHSSTWTETMMKQFMDKTARQKKDYASLVRHCGFGVPNLERALWSLSNSLTLVIEDSLQPFRKGKKDPNFNEMRFYTLPWPKEQLEELGTQNVEMRVTLSYFIDPNPSSRTKYHYESHGLRFEIKGPNESEQSFKSRINTAIDKDEQDKISKDSSHTKGWLLGPKSRNKGSIHSDIWQGSAANLAACGTLAIHPTAGWWKYREKLVKYDSIAQYSLLVSIHAPKIDVDLYTPIAQQLPIPIETIT